MILLKLSSYVDETTGYQCEIPHNTSMTDQIFCIRQIPEKKLEYNEIVYQLFICFEKTNDSVTGKYSYILMEFRVPIKLVRLIKVCLNETYNKVNTGKHLSDNFPI
jgi:hypothetical protein